MHKKTKTYPNEPLNDLIECLKSIQSMDEITKDDADNLLVGIIMLNYKFLETSLKKEGIESHERIMEILLKRIKDILKIMA
jgi:hypothetical protein